MNAPSRSFRSVATAELVLKVGSDFRTIQDAVNAVMWDYDLRGHQARIRVDDGHYSEGIRICGVPPGCTARPAIIIEGTGPSRCWIDVDKGHAIENWGGQVLIGGVKLSARKGACIFAHESGQTNVGKVEFAESGGDHVHVSHGHFLIHRSDYSVTGGAAIHAHVTSGGDYSNSAKVTLLNRPHFRHEFHGLNYARSRWRGASFEGEATGKRHLIHYSAVCGGCGDDPETFFPGDRAGTVSHFSTMV